MVGVMEYRSLTVTITITKSTHWKAENFPRNENAPTGNLRVRLSTGVTKMMVEKSVSVLCTL